MKTRTMLAAALAPALIGLAACSGSATQAALPAPQLDTCPVNFDKVEGLSDVTVDIQGEGLTSQDAINAWKQIICYQAGDFQFTYQGNSTISAPDAANGLERIMTPEAINIFTPQYETLLDEATTKTESELSETARSAQAFVWVTPQDSESAGIGVFRPGLPGAVTISGTPQAPIVTVTTNSSIHAPTTSNEDRTLNWNITYTLAGDPNPVDPRQVWKVQTWGGALEEGNLG